MRPLKLVMEGFGCFPKAEVDFSKCDNLLLIAGETGSGKTTIFDGISYALYGKLSNDGQGRTEKDIVSHFVELTNEGRKIKKQMTMRVSLKFLHLDKLYEVERKKIFYEEGSKPVESLLKKFDKDGNILQTITQNVTHEIETNILHLNHDQFKKIAMIAQGEFRKILVQDNPDEQKKLFREIFGTQLYEIFEAKIQEKFDEKKSELNTENNRLKSKWETVRCDANFLPETLKEIREHLANKAILSKKDFEDIEKFLTEHNAHDRNLQKNLSEKLEECKKNSDEYLREEQKFKNGKKKFSACQSLSAEKKELDEKEKTIQEKQNRIQLAEQADKVVPAYKVFKDAEKDLREYAPKKSTYEKNFQTAQKNSDALAPEREALQQTETKLQEREAQQKNFPSEISDLKQKREQLLDVHGKVDQFWKNENALKNLAQANQLYEKNLALVLAKQLREGDVCPVCGSTHHPKKIHGTQSNNEAFLLKKHQEFEKLQATQTQLKEFILKFCETLDQQTLPKIKARGIAVKQKIEQKEAAEKSLNDDYKKFRDEQKNFHDKEKSVSNELIKAESEFKNFQENLANKKNNYEKRRDEFFEKLSENNFADEQKFLSQRMSVQDLNQLKKEVESFCNEKESLKNRLFFEEKTFLELMQKPYEAFTEKIFDDELRRVSQKRQESENNTNTMQNELAALAVRLQNNTDLYEFFNHSKATYLTLNKEYDVLNGLQKILQNKGRRSISLEEFVQQTLFLDVVVLANERLKIMTRDLYHFETQPQKPFALNVFDSLTGRLRDVKTLSGGESFLASLALALGLSDTISKYAGGVTSEALFIDEGFGALDETALGFVTNMLMNLKQNKMVAVISHCEELKQNISSQILVKKTNHGSIINYQKI